MPNILETVPSYKMRSTAPRGCIQEKASDPGVMAKRSAAMLTADVENMSALGHAVNAAPTPQIARIPARKVLYKQKCKAFR